MSIENLVAIDPGKKWNAYARFRGGVLLAVEYKEVFREPIVSLQLPWVGGGGNLIVVVEKPQVYPGGRTQRPNDLIDVAIGAGIGVGHFLNATADVAVEQITPRTWKGTVPKEVMERRILSRLTDSENDVILQYSATLPKSKRHNVVDAVGIGLWKLGRL